MAKNEIIQRLTKIIDVRRTGAENSESIARVIIESLRELPEQPGHRYTTGEYSRRTQAAFVDDALSK